MSIEEGEGGGCDSICRLHEDILGAHILTRLDGLTLISIFRTSTQLRSLATQEELWSKICQSTWPSTNSLRVLQVISNFPGGFRSFFSSSFPLLSSSTPIPTRDKCKDRSITEIISAVDIYYGKEVIFSKVVETETVSDWFKCSPFRIDLLDQKNTCQTCIPYPDNKKCCRELGDEVKLSWIVVDPTWKRAVNVSSFSPVLVEKHWLSGEVHARFGTVVRCEKGVVMLGVMIKCGVGARGGGMEVREVSLQVEDLEGMLLNGRDSLGILHGVLEEGKRGIKGREGKEGKRRYEEFLVMKRESNERKLRKEWMLDMVCVGFGVLLVSLVLFLLFTRYFWCV